MEKQQIETSQSEQDRLDAELKALVRGYDPKDRVRNRRLLTLLWPKVERFAAYRSFFKDDWIRERFLTWAAEEFPNFLLAYRERACYFTTWFSRVLNTGWRRQVYNCRRLESYGNGDPEGIADEEPLGEDDVLLFEDSLGSLSVREQLFFRVRYPELMDESSLRTLEESGLLVEDRLSSFRHRVDAILQAAGCRRGRVQERLAANHCRRLRGDMPGMPPYRLYQLTIQANRMAAALRKELARMSYEEMAFYFGKPSGSIASTLFRIRRKLEVACSIRARVSERQVF